MKAKVKLISGILFSDKVVFSTIKDGLAHLFGEIDFESDELDFTHTEYYVEEMGGKLKRKFVSFRNLFELKEIYQAKLRTNELEKRFLEDGRRMVNIDPGYLTLSKLVLLSTKDYTHRIYLDEGIFAEVTLYFKDKAYNPWPWTYPDYKTGQYLEIFSSIRELYKKDLKESVC